MLSIVKHISSEAGPAPDFPAHIIGAIAMVIFIALAFVTWSYRDVANRHDHKSGGDHKH